MSKIEVDAITEQSGSTLTVGGGASKTVVADATTVTLGRCGGTVALASGATQTGFGRTGTVNWITTKKTSGFTAVSGEGYFCDTAASGAFTLTLPASPSAGDIVGFKDYNGNFSTANLTIGRNSQPINGGTATNVVISTSGASILLVYVDATQGWVATQDDESTFSGETFIVASGGTVTTCGGCKIHTFTSPGTFTVCSVSTSATNNRVSYMVVAGGGGSGGDSGGGGGAGGFREDKSPVTAYTASPIVGAGPITVTATGFPIVIGAGGSGGSAPAGNASTGNPSTFSTITSAGGGTGGSRPSSNGGSGGSGGGARSTAASAGAGNTPPVSPAQGFNGGGATPTPTANSAGGGGATALGVYATPTCVASTGGAGGAGATTSINGSATAFAGGAGGGGGGSPCQPGGTGGAGGGANGADGGAGTPGNNGTVNTGGGGSGGNDCAAGGSGGSGIVIIRYKFQ
jgi:hypothetical protein